MFFFFKCILTLKKKEEELVLTEGGDHANGTITQTTTVTAPDLEDSTIYMLGVSKYAI